MYKRVTDLVHLAQPVVLQLFELALQLVCESPWVKRSVLKRGERGLRCGGVQVWASPVLVWIHDRDVWCSLRICMMDWTGSSPSRSVCAAAQVEVE